MLSRGSSTIDTTALEPASGGQRRRSRNPTLQWVAPVYQRTPLPRSDAAVVLGRDRTCTTTLSGREVSRQHARLQWAGPLLVLEDLESRNGTYVNGARIQQTRLEEGSVLRIGDWVAVLVDLPREHQAEAMELAPGLIGGPRLAAALAPLRRAAPSTLPVVLVGETGTGKERVAHAVHGWSGRAGRLVAVNCAAIPEGLAEAELFGYRRGAFTGAEQSHLGHLRAADRGTLLLDEFLELPASVQAKLLRALESLEVQSLGEAHPSPIDTRIIVATQTPLEEAVEEGRLRPDLQARIDGISVTIPPLRERREDIPALVSAFLAALAQGEPPALEARLVESLLLCDWPLNVRELKSCVHRLLVLHGHEPRLRASHLPGRIQRRQSAPPTPPESAEERRDRELERLIAALREHHGNVARACTAVGLSRQRAYRLVQESGVDLKELRKASEPPTDE